MCKEVAKVSANGTMPSERTLDLPTGHCFVGDVCDYPPARNLVTLTVAVASETLVAYELEGARGNCSATLRDLCVGPREVRH